MRVQPNTLDTLNLSRVVLADVVPLSRGRSLSTVNDPHAPQSTQLTVQGPGSAGTTLATRLAVTVQVDGGAPGTPLWMNVGDALGATAGPPMPIPLPFARGSRAMRLVVREYETRVADAPESGDPLQVSRNVERLIYADMITV